MEILRTPCVAGITSSGAPQLNIVGAAAGGAGVDMTSSPEMFEAGNVLSGIPFGACIAASRTFPDFDFAGHLTPHGQAMVAADELVEKYRREGVDVVYRRYRLGEHLIVMFRGVPPALRFLGDRLAAACRR